MVTESAGWGPVVEQLALHGPVDGSPPDYQTAVATTSYPFHLAPVVDKNHSNLSSPSKTNTSRSRPTPAIRKIPGGGEARQFGGSPTDASCSGRQQPSWSIDRRRARYSHRLGEHTKTSHQELHLYLPPKIPQQIILITVPISQFNLCCIILKLWCTHN